MGLKSLLAIGAAISAIQLHAAENSKKVSISPYKANLIHPGLTGFDIHVSQYLECHGYERWGNPPPPVVESIKLDLRQVMTKNGIEFSFDENLTLANPFLGIGKSFSFLQDLDKNNCLISTYINVDAVDADDSSPMEQSVPFIAHEMSQWENMGKTLSGLEIKGVFFEYYCSVNRPLDQCPASNQVYRFRIEYFDPIKQSTCTSRKDVEFAVSRDYIDAHYPHAIIKKEDETVNGCPEFDARAKN